MSYLELPPSLPLRDFVRCFWAMERSGGDGAETVWPDGKTELLFHFGARYRHGGQLLSTGFLIGPLTRYVRLDTQGPLRLVGARFTPWGFRALFGIPMSELRNELLAADAVLGRQMRELEDALSDLDARRAISTLEQFLLRRAASARAPSPAVRQLSRALLSPPWRADLAAETRRFGVSTRQLERYFRDEVGLAPKALAVIARFDAARTALTLGPPVRSLTDLALDFGYSDHPHLVRDFRRFLGMSPRELLAWRASLRADDVVFLQDDHRSDREHAAH